MEKMDKWNPKMWAMHKITMGVGIFIFGLVLWMTSSATALQSNLNWPMAFMIIGILTIFKGLWMWSKK